MSALQWLNRKESRWPLLLLALGCMERMAWLLARSHPALAGGEAGNVALAFARTETVSDVFARGSGPTAHLNPVLPVLAGYVYRLLGIHSERAEAVLATFSIGVSLLSGYLFYRVFEALGARRTGRIVALGIFCLVPLNMSLEAVQFRIWEGALASALAGWALLLLVRMDIRGSARWPQIVGVALLIAFLFFVNPALGLTLYACAGIWLIRCQPWRNWLPIAATAAVALAVVLAPWTLRNYETFGRFIPLRSNFGLELALANHPAAVSGDSEHAVFVNRLYEIHPQQSDEAFARMEAAGGEIAYADELGAEAKAWIFAHPAAFAQLCVKHLEQFYFLPTWQWTIYDYRSRATLPKTVGYWTVSALGLLGAACALFLWRGRWVYAAATALLPALPYIITQPVPRYRYIVYAITLFLGCELVARLVGAARPVGAPKTRGAQAA
jgi:hypothetical protein